MGGGVVTETAQATAETTREQVRARYAAAATAVTTGQGCGCGTASAAAVEACCAPADSGACCDGSGATVEDGFGAGLYSADEQAELPAEALAASLGCGNPLAVAELRAGET